MSPSFERLVVNAFGAKNTELVVLGSEPLTPHYHRVHVDCGDFLRSHGVHPSMWLRLWFDDDGKDHQRAFTLVDADEASGRATLEFALHDGVAARWSQNVTAGTRIRASLLGSKCPWPSEKPAPGTSWERTVLIGGTACVPAIRSLLDHWSEAPATVLLHSEYDDDRDIPLGLAAATDVEWFAMGDEALLTRTHDFAGEATTRFWVTTEASATRAVVRALRKDHGVGKERLHAQAYWSAAG